MFKADPTKKMLVKIKTTGEMEVHAVPWEWTEEEMDAMANELLGTEGAEKHELGVDETGIMRTVIYSYNQSYGHLLDFNKHLKDGMLEGINTLVMLYGDAVVALSPSFLEVN